MKFKKIELEGQWLRMVRMEAMLVPVVCYAAELSSTVLGVEPVVTSVYRSEADHAALLARLGRDYYPSVHMFWRGLDLRSWVYEQDEIDMLVGSLNQRFKYGRGKRVAVYHDVGAGAHLHLQAPEQLGVWRPQ